MKELKNLKTLNKNNLLVSVAINSLEPDNIAQSFYKLSNQTEPVDVLILLSDNLTEEEVIKIEEIAKEPYMKVLKKDEENKSSFEMVKSESKLNYAVERTSAKNFSDCFNESFNLALENNYKWFSFVEPTDLTEVNWVENFTKYSSELDEISVFFPLIRQIKAGGMVGHLNEATWIEGRAEIAGQADLQILMSWNCLAPIGAMFKIEDIKENSEERDGKYYPFKTNLSLASSYEFFLRMVYEDLKTYTIPRYGYQMLMDSNVQEINSYSSKIPSNIVSIPKEKGGMSQKELLFWMEQAKSEYFMSEDREIEFSEESA